MRRGPGKTRQLPMSPSFDLRALTRQLLDTSDLSDPNALATELRAMIPDNDLAGALDQTLPGWVRHEMSLGRLKTSPGPTDLSESAETSSKGAATPGKPPPNHRSRKLELLQKMASDRLRDRVKGADCYKLFGDFTVDDLNHAAAVREEQARQNSDCAAEYRELARIITQYRVTYVRELPDAVLVAKLSNAA